MNRVRYAAKRILGPNLTHRIGAWKQELWARASGSTASPAISEATPWCSPNTFGKIVATYSRVRLPYIHEYGCGASTLWHLKVILGAGGTLHVVEHDSNWAARVHAAALEILTRHASPEGLSCARTLGTPVVGDTSVADVEYCAQSTDGAEARFSLKVRPPNHRTADVDGTAEEFHDYIRSLDRPADMVIVDGRARTACIRHVLDNELLRPGGAVALFEAGRGVEGWLDAPALKGTSNYQPEVQRMLALGAQVIDGSGYDSWPGQTVRRSFGSLSKRYPLELCLLQLPEGMGIGAAETRSDRST